MYMGNTRKTLTDEFASVHVQLLGHRKPMWTLEEVKWETRGKIWFHVREKGPWFIVNTVRVSGTNSSHSCHSSLPFSQSEAKNFSWLHCNYILFKKKSWDQYYKCLLFIKKVTQTTNNSITSEASFTVSFLLTSSYQILFGF